MEIDKNGHVKLPSNVQLTMFLKDGLLLVPVQNEVENLALETVGTHRSIYFDKTPINEELYLLYDKVYKTWVLFTERKYTG